MRKVSIVDHSTREVMESFKPADLAELPKDVVTFINKLPKADNLKPLDKDVFQLSTYKTSELKRAGGQVIPAERKLEIRLPKDENSAYYACLTDNAQALEQKRGGFFPISVEGLKNAFRSITEASNRG